MSKKYLGWVVVGEPAPGMNAPVFAERVEDGVRKRHPTGYGNSGCAQAIEWWDKQAGSPVELTATVMGCYRVSVKSTPVVLHGDQVADAVEVMGEVGFKETGCRASSWDRVYYAAQVVFPEADDDKHRVIADAVVNYKLV